jgi:hypothetical protein
MEAEVMVLLAAAAAAIALGRRARRRAAPWPAVAAGAVTLFCGVVIGGLISLHLAAILGSALAGKGHGGAPRFVYDFGFYSLVLLGVVILVPALVSIAQAPRLTAGDSRAWRRAAWSSLALVAVNAPLAPIQNSAYLLGGLALVDLVALWLARRSLGDSRNL